MKQLMTLLIAAVLVAGTLAGCHRGHDDRAPSVPTGMTDVDVAR